MRPGGRAARPRRTGLAALALALGLGGCGFAPLYAQGPDDPTADLPEIFVANIPAGRFGQELRQGLQLRLHSPASGADSRYVLSSTIGDAATGVAIAPDNSATYTRIVGTASWTLSTAGLFPKVLASGSARSLDGFNNIDFQFFQSTISGETANSRIAANLADAIAIQVATWFRREREQGRQL